MAYEMNDLKGILFLVLFAVPMISSANINCSGKAFHCVNSTHFRICVDLGGGVSTTIDDFIIPCPPTTVCHEQNIFECEFSRIEITTPQLDVIGVSIRSDASVTSAVINSETASTLPIETPSVILKENFTVTTSAKPEEVISAPEVDIKQHTGVKHNNIMNSVSTIQVNSDPTYSANEIDIVEQTNQNTVKHTDFVKSNSNRLESTAETSLDKAVTASLTDIFTFKDTTNSRGLLDLISNNPQSVASSRSILDVLTGLNDYNATTIDKYITRQVVKSDDKIEIVTDEFNKSNTDEISTTPMAYVQTKSQSFYTDGINNHNDSVGEITTTEKIPESRIEINTTPVVNMYTKSFNIDAINNQTNPVHQNIAERNATDEITTTDQIPKTKTEVNMSTTEINNIPVVNMYTKSFNIDAINSQTNPVHQNIAEQNATGEITATDQIPKTKTEVNTSITVHNYSQRFNIDDINNETNLDNQKSAKRNTTVEITTTDPIPETEINSTPMVYMYSQTFDIDDINNQTNSVNQKLEERNTTGEITAPDQIPETGTETNTTTMVNLYTQTFNINDLNNQTSSGIHNIEERDTIGEITTVEQITETRIEISTIPTVNEQTQSLNIDGINNQTNSVNKKIAVHNATGEITTIDQIIETSRTEINTTPMIYVYTQKVIFDDKNNQTNSVNENLVEFNATGEKFVTDPILETRAAINVQTFNINDINNQTNTVNQHIPERNTLGEITTTDRIQEINTKYLTFDKINAMPEPVIIDERPQETTEMTYVSLVTEENIIYTTKATFYTTLQEPISNDSIVVEKPNIAHSLETIATADTLIISASKSNQINKKSLMTKNNADEHNNIERQESVYNASSSDLFMGKVTGPTPFQTSPVPNVDLTTETVYKIEEVINELSASLVPFSVDKYHRNIKADTDINNDTTPALNNVTANSDPNITAADWTHILTNVSTNITPETFVRYTSDNYTSLDLGTTENVISHMDNIYQDVMNQEYSMEAVTFPDKVNIDQKTDPGDVGNTTIYWKNLTNMATKPYARDESETTILVDLLELQNGNSVNIINQTYNLTLALNVETSQSEVPKAQSPPLNQYATGFTTQTPNLLHETTISMDSVKKVPNNVSKIADTNNVPMDYEIEKNTTTFLLTVTHDNNIEVSTDRILTMSAQEPLATTDPAINRMEELDTTTQGNISRIANETVSDITTTHMVINEGDTNFNTSNWNNSASTDPTMPMSTNPNEEMMKTTIINSINGINVETTTPHSRIVIDDGIKIMPPFNTTDLAANILTNGILKQSSLKHKFVLSSTENYKTNPSLLHANIKTTTPRDLGASMTTTTYNVTNEIVKGRESVLKQIENLPKNSLTTEYSLYQTLTNLEVSPTRPAIKDVHTENVEDKMILSSIGIGTESPLFSTIKHDAINLQSTHNDDIIPTEDTNIFILSKGQTTDHGSLPIIGIEATTLNSLKDKQKLNTSGSVISADDFKTTSSVTSSTQINSPLIIHEEIKSNNVQLVTELSRYTSGVIEPQNAISNVPNFSSQIEVTQMTTEPTHRPLFSQITLAPTANTKSDTSPIFITTEQPLYAKSTKIDPLSFRDKTTETVIHSVTNPDFMVETIKVNQDKTSGTNHNIFSEVTFNNRTVNNSSYSVKTEKNIIIEFPSQNSTQNMTFLFANSLNVTNREDMNIETENATMQTYILTDSDKTDTGKINDFSIDENSTFKAINLKSDIDQNKVLPADLLLAVPMGHKEDQTIDTTTNLSYVKNTGSATPNLMQTKDIMTNQNGNMVINNSVKTNINVSSITPNKTQVESGNISHIYNKNNTKTNGTTSYGNFSQYYVMFSDNLEQHLISANHTIMSDIQSNLNESDKRSNETGNELKIRGTNMYSTENIKLNASSKGKITINVIASPFDCSNYTRGKYADKKDCTKFYTCLGNLQPLVGICPNNTVFSEINKQCTRNLSHCVRNNQFRCLFEGRFNDFFKDNIYYICVKNSMNSFVRYKLICLADYHLNKVSVKCEKNIEIPSQSASSVSENSKIYNDESIQVVPEIKFDESTKSSVELECENEGQFPHAKDCSKYYICTKTKKGYLRKIKKCASEEVYDKEKKKCVETDSGEC